MRDMRPLEPVHREALTPDPRWSEPQPKDKPQGPSERAQRRRAAKQAAFGQLTNKWSGHTGHHLVDYRDPTKETAAAETPRGERTALTFPLTGAVHPATLLVGINSDVASPVVATLLRPPLAGATLTGRFDRSDEGVLIAFNRIHYQGQSYEIDAYAVDLDTATASVATKVNRLTFTRWAAVLGSALLGGLQRGVLADADVFAPGYGTVVVERDYDDRELAAIAVGEIGRRTRPMAERYWNRPPTVTVDEAVGVVFLSDVAVAINDTDRAARDVAARTLEGAAALRQYLEESLPGALGHPYRGGRTRGYDPALEDDPVDGDRY
jgi:hypothetical protein